MSWPNIDLTMLPDEKFDPTMDVSTGAAVIFGATGGVMEAALRTCAYVLTGENPDPDKTFLGARGMDGWKEAEYDVAGVRVRTAVVSGLGNARKLIRALRRGEVQYDFVEVMACPGGCVGGGGQPIDKEDRELGGIRGDRLHQLENGDRCSTATMRRMSCGSPTKIRRCRHSIRSSWRHPAERRRIICCIPIILDGRCPLPPIWTRMSG